MDALLSELTAIAGPEHVLTDPDLVAGYTTDWTRRFSGRARCVIRPGDAGQVAAVLLACARHGVPVVSAPQLAFRSACRKARISA